MMKAEKIVLGDSDDMERLLDKQKVIANLVPRSPTVIRKGESSISSMLSASEARNTGFSITAHVRTLCCDFG